MYSKLSEVKPLKITKMSEKLTTYIFSVSERCVEGMCVWGEKIPDVCEAFHLELLRLFLYDLSNKRIKKRGLVLTFDPLLAVSLPNFKRV